MRTRMVILGGGTGGTMMANRLRRRHDPAQVSVAVVDKDDRHVYQPGLLFVPFELAYADEIVRSYAGGCVRKGTAVSCRGLTPLLANGDNSTTVAMPPVGCE